MFIKIVDNAKENFSTSSEKLTQPKYKSFSVIYEKSRKRCFTGFIYSRQRRVIYIWCNFIYNVKLFQAIVCRWRCHFGATKVYNFIQWSFLFPNSRKKKQQLFMLHNRPYGTLRHASSRQPLNGHIIKFQLVFPVGKRRSIYRQTQKTTLWAFEVEKGLHLPQEIKIREMSISVEQKTSN